jgi:hypothetical protein
MDTSSIVTSIMFAGAATGNQAGVVIVTGYNPNLADAAKVFAKIKGRFFVTTLTKPVTVATLSAALSAS